MLCIDAMAFVRRSSGSGLLPVLALLLVTALLVVGRFV